MEDTQLCLGHNFYLYESNPGRFILIPWDVSEAFWRSTGICGCGRGDISLPLSHHLLGNEGHWNTVKGFIWSLVYDITPIGVLYTKLRQYEALSEPYLGYSFADNLEEIIREHYQRLMADLETDTGICEERPESWD